MRELSLSTSSTVLPGASGHGAGTGSSVSDSEVVRREKERHGKELRLLRKTIEEMELRIETQKQTLATRDESIKKLMEMVQAKSTLSFIMLFILLFAEFNVSCFVFVLCLDPFVLQYQRQCGCAIKMLQIKLR